MPYKNRWSRGLPLAAALLTVMLLTSCGNASTSGTVPEETEAPTAVPTAEPLTIAGLAAEGTEKTLYLNEEKLSAEDYEVLLTRLDELPDLRTVVLGTNLTDEETENLCAAWPEIVFVRDFELYGVPVCTSDSYIDLTGVEITDTEDLERAVSCMPFLEKVNMTDTGLSNEELEALNERFENVQIVWTIHLGTYYDIRTDATAFRAYLNTTAPFTKENLDQLSYCHDMICLDIGHNHITDLEFLYGMPHLKYLILLETYCPDITPVGSLKELIYLEMNYAQVDSIEPLEGCTSLQDVTIERIWGVHTREEIMATLQKMNWLKRVWYDPKLLSTAQANELRAENPDTEYILNESTYMAPWRQTSNYYDMRDVLAMWYMRVDSYNLADYKTVDGVNYDFDVEIP